jgi:hypothetical protein
MNDNKKKIDESYKYNTTDLNSNEEININPKYFHLFNNFLTKENCQKYSFIKEIMPEYSDIDSQIQKKIVQVRNLYGVDPMFKEMQSPNSYAMNFFRKGLKKLFFGKEGIVTKKNVFLKNYHKSFESKLDVNSKIYAGSLDYYDFLSNHDHFFDRLKNSRRKILEINGNFSISNPNQEKMHAAYIKYAEKRKKKYLLLKQINNNSIDNNFFNKTNYKNINTGTNDRIKSSFFNNTFSKKRDTKRLLLFDNIKTKKKKINAKNIFLNYSKNCEITKNNNEANSKMNYTSYNTSNNKPFKSLANSIETEDNEANKEKSEYLPESRETKRLLSNKTTIVDSNPKDESMIIEKSILNPNINRKVGKKKLNSLILYKPIDFEDQMDKTKRSLNELLSTSKSKREKINQKKTEIEAYTSNKVLKNNKTSGTDYSYTNTKKKKFEGIQEIKQSLKDIIDSTIFPNKKIERNLNNFIDANKKYESQKKKLLKTKIKEEFFELKEDIKNTGNYNELTKNVDFSDVKSFSPRDNHRVNNRIKTNTFNLVFKYKSKLQKNVPVKEFLKGLEKIKEKQNENKFLTSVRKNFKKNFRVIHNLTIDLDHIKKKYNY